jgi:hypothetical protein
MQGVAIRNGLVLFTQRRPFSTHDLAEQVPCCVDIAKRRDAHA